MGFAERWSGRCARFTGSTSEKTRSTKSPIHLNRNPHVRGTENILRKDPAPGWRGGRTSVSAPLDKHPKTPAPTDSTKTRNGQPPNVRATANTHRKGPAPGWRGGGPPCPLHWANIRKHPSQWVAQQPGSANPNVRPTANTPRKGPAPGWRGGGPLCPLHWTNIRKSPFQRAEKKPGSVNPHVRATANTIRPSHVLKGHSSIAQGSCAALPWVAGQ